MEIKYIQHVPFLPLQKIFIKKYVWLLSNKCLINIHVHLPRSSRETEREREQKGRKTKPCKEAAEMNRHFPPEAPWTDLYGLQIQDNDSASQDGGVIRWREALTSTFIPHLDMYSQVWWPPAWRRDPHGSAQHSGVLRDSTWKPVPSEDHLHKPSIRIQRQGGLDRSWRHSWPWMSYNYSTTAQCGRYDYYYLFCQRENGSTTEIRSPG